MFEKWEIIKYLGCDEGLQVPDVVSLGLRESLHQQFRNFSLSKYYLSAQAGAFIVNKM